MSETASSPSSLHVVCYNVWGLKYIAKHRPARLAEIGRRIAIASPQFDIVGLQECFTQDDFKRITEATKAVLPYSKYYHSGSFGGGLAILSRWPIQESSMFRYPLNGRPTAFFRGDWYVGKGVACAKIKTGPRRCDIIEVFCTHLHAPYEREPNDSYICHRTAQAWEIAKLMRGASEKGHLVIGLGDFNMLPLSLAHQLITTHAPVVDVWRIFQPDSSIGAAVDSVEQARGLPIPNVAHNITINGATCDSALNTWRWPKSKQKALDKGEIFLVERTVSDQHAKRLDYIFIGTNAPDIANNDETQDSPWKLASVKLGMVDVHPTLRCSLSDHFSVEALLVRDVSRDTGREPLDIQPPLVDFLPVEVYDQILSMIALYDVRERRQRQLRLGHFLLQVAVAIGCLVAVWFVPRTFVAFILMLLSTLGLSAGVVDGLIGGLFMSSEIRALKEFEWEIRNVRNDAMLSLARDADDSKEDQKCA
ncbi:MAG: phospholipase C type enzyme [Vezdaea aestivalis]|nr:MAG: phospholipase C type enzyme [Vezdaea aestivalis]